MKQLKPKILARIARMDAATAKAQAFANYWSAFATSDTCKTRSVYRGAIKANRLTVSELEKEAFDTALDHIRGIEEIANNKARLIEDPESWETLI